jgi:hypothetical protein
MTGELKRRRFAKGPPRPQYLESRSDDRLVMMILSLSAEVAALRERLDTHEKLADAATLPSGAAVEAFVPDAQNEETRARLRQTLIERVTRPLLDDTDES